MQTEELWSNENEAQVSTLLGAVAEDDLAGALFSIEGAPADTVEKHRAQIRAWGEQVEKRASLQTPLVQAQALQALLGDELHFSGEPKDYYHPRNSFFHEVLTRRKGLPILLSSVWIEVGRAAGMIVQGIGMPGHFVARVGGSGGTLIDPFAGGRLLSTEDCKRIVEEISGGELSWRDDFLAPNSLVQILERVLQNLLNIYAHKNDPVRIFRILSFLCALRPEASEHAIQRATVAELLGARQVAAEGYAEVVRRFPGTQHANAAAKREKLVRRALLLN